MDIERVVFSRATTHAGLAALIAARCYPGILPQNPTLPALTYQLISDPMVKRVFTGVTNMRYPRVQVDCWATTYAGCTALAVQVRAAFQNYAVTSSGLALKFTIVDGDFDNYEPDSLWFRRSVDLRLWYKL